MMENQEDSSSVYSEEAPRAVRVPAASHDAPAAASSEVPSRHAPRAAKKRQRDVLSPVADFCDTADVGVNNADTPSPSINVPPRYAN